MTEIKVEVIKVPKLGKHPNADTLSICHVKGWQCIVKTEDFVREDGSLVELGAYIPIDSVLPQSDRWEFLKGYKYRVKTIKLRGILSQGLLIPAEPHWKEGDNITEELEVQKYEPPEPVHLGGLQAKDVAGFQKYTDIQRWKNYPDIFMPGDQVVITEKIHGTNARFGLLDGQFYVGTHKTVRKPESRCIYVEISKKLEIEEKVRSAIGKMINGTNVTIYGEIYGKSIQDLRYGSQEPQLAVFDILVDGNYCAFHTVENMCHHLGLPVVPLLYEGEFSLDLLKIAEENAFKGGHLREGIIIQSQIPEWEPRLGRKMLKYLSERYELRKGGTEHH